MSSVSKSIGKTKNGQRRVVTKNAAIVYSIDEIRKLLKVGRASAYEVAREIGRRIGGKRRGRLIVSRQALDLWLHGEGSR